MNNLAIKISMLHCRHCDVLLTEPELQLSSEYDELCTDCFELSSEITYGDDWDLREEGEV